MEMLLKNGSTLHYNYMDNSALFNTEELNINSVYTPSKDKLELELENFIADVRGEAAYTVSSVL